MVVLGGMDSNEAVMAYGEMYDPLAQVPYAPCTVVPMHSITLRYRTHHTLYSLCTPPLSVVH
jgi:hypothetical protein